MNRRFVFAFVLAVLTVVAVYYKVLAHGTPGFTPYTILNFTISQNPMPGGLYGGAIVTNAGASGPITWNLPDPHATGGDNFCIVVSAAQNVVIEPNGNDRILIATNGNGDSLTSNTVGSVIELVAIDASNWVVKASSGTWTDTN
jgi:hypothetical protein